MMGRIRIHVLSETGILYPAVADPAVTDVLQFKVYLSRVFEKPVHRQRLVYRGQVLEDNRTLESYGVQADHTIHLEFLSPTPEVLLAADAVNPDALRPVISQMMQTLLSSPKLMKMVIKSKPELESMVKSNPQLSKMLENPELVRPFMQQIDDVFSIPY